MHKRIRMIIKNIQNLYNSETIKRMAEKHLFSKRKGKLSAEDFLNLCTFKGEDLCSVPLTRLAARLEANDQILISPQGLNKKFNKEAVNFMKSILTEMLKCQNGILRNNESLLKMKFNRITIVDSTGFKLNDKLKDIFKGAGVASAMKIQLQYDLITGAFILCEIKEGANSDASYIGELQKNMQKGDLCLKDLGYYKIEDLKFINDQEAFYVSKVKINTNLYRGNEITEYGPKGEPKTRKRYSYLNIQELAEPLDEGETLELDDIYIGNTLKNRTKTRLILTKLTAECKRKKEIHTKNAKDRGSIKGDARNIWWLDYNCYITNVPKETLSKEKVHEIYTLRWGVELMFKIWKSLFKIHVVKKINLERIHCFIYGRLIMLLLTSSIVFTARDILYSEKNKEISEIVSFGIVLENFDYLEKNIFNSGIKLYQIIRRMVNSIDRLGKKSRKKGKNTPRLIFKGIKIQEGDLVKLAS